MNYKVNQCDKPIECNTIRFSELPSLLFGKISLANKEVEVFDASEYCKSMGGKLDVYKFMQTNRIYIDRVVYNNNLDVNNLFFVLPNQKILILSEIVIVFLISINPEMFLYFIDMMLDLLGNGIVVSDKKIMELVMDRVPNDILKQIMDSRNECNEQDK